MRLYLISNDFNRRGCSVAAIVLQESLSRVPGKGEFIQ